MEKLKYEFSEDEVNFLIQSLDQVQVKGLQAISFMMQMVQKLQNPTNKKEYDLAKAKALTQKITGSVEEKSPITISPEQIRKAEEIIQKVKEQKKEPEKVEHKQGG